MVTNTNLFQPTNFKIVIDRKKFPNLEWFAQSVDHPSVGLQSANTGYMRVADVPMPGDKLEFPEVTFNIIMDEEMKAYQEAFDWMVRLVEEPFTPSLKATDTQEASEHDITLMLLNSANRKQKSIVYKNAFPTNLGNISLAAENEPVPILVPISFQYLRFEIN